MKIIASIAYLLFFCTQLIYSQNVSLEYIFQEPNIINPRPALKFINTYSNKVYYYADDDYNGSLSLFDYNYKTNEYYKYSDTVQIASEFVIMPNGNAICIIEGDIYISKNFVNTRAFSKDFQITFSDEYEYSPIALEEAVIYRKRGNYYFKKYDTLQNNTLQNNHNELAITNDESDSVSYQILAISKKSVKDTACITRLLIARYNNSEKIGILIPDYTGKFVKAETKKRGISRVNLYECCIIESKKDSLAVIRNEIIFHENIRYSTAYADYSPDGTRLILDSETLDRKQRKLFVYNTKSKTLNEIYSEIDTAWFERHDNATRFIDSNLIIFESEISGYNNIYKINSDGSGLLNLTAGNFTVMSSSADINSGKIYFTANSDKPYIYNIYSAEISDGKITQHTFLKGECEDLIIAPDEKKIFFYYSELTSPREIYSLDTENHTVQQITNTISPLFKNVKWKLPELIKFQNEEDNEVIYGFVYKPDNFNPQKKYPLICFAHGAGYLQNVTFGFSPYQDNFMVNTFFTQNGYIILDLDFRGSKGYGKNFRNKTYRNLGRWEVSDYTSGINYLNKLGFIDINKVGIYGGSYGGFITLYSLFTKPDIFKTGAALRAVSNWKIYFYSNKWYTLARLGYLDSAGIDYYYDISSPITYSSNLQGSVLLTHGMLDDNVFFQDMVQLTQKLIDEKKDFEVMIYPMESHGFYRQSSWLDQYKRIFNWFERKLK